MEYDLKNLDCDKMFVHPLSPHLVPKLEKEIPQLANIQYNWIPKKFTKASVLRYVILLYDPNSPIQSFHSLDWFARKFEAVAYAGFDYTKSRDGHNRFDPIVLDMVLGKIKEVNDMIIFYLGWASNQKWRHLVYLQESLMAYTRVSLQGDTDSIKYMKEVRLVREEIDKTSNEIAHTFEETEEFVNRFYYQIEKSRLALRAEDYAMAIANGADFRADNPYSVSYQVEPLKFVGDKIPDSDEW